VRRVRRPSLDSETHRALRGKQARADSQVQDGTLNATAEWERARKTVSLKAAMKTLKDMAGPSAHCMYCVHSEGADIDHFWPKSAYPDRMFEWNNLLLSCPLCGRIKGVQFPLSDDNMPLLIDPSAEEPWQHLDFNPETGVITARYDRALKDWSPRGRETVRVLRLDEREALSKGYSKSYRRLRHAVDQFLASDGTNANDFPEHLADEDGHGLLGWFVFGDGATDSTFRELRESYPSVWSELVAVVAG
jgi:uncharacterized protein (TIGR02646 family)